MIKRFSENFSQLCKINENRQAILLDYENDLLAVSYSEIFSLINQVHHQLGNHQRILSLLPNSLQKITFFLSSCYFGRDFCPMQCFITERELKRVIILFKPDVCLIYKNLLHPSIIQLLEDYGIKIINIEEDVKIYLQNINAVPIKIDNLYSTQSGNVYLYTSGTTGDPKFLILNIDKLWASAQNFSTLYKLAQISDLRFWNYLPMSYLGGLFNLCLIPLAAGGAFYVDEPFSGKTFLNFWNQVNRLKINLIWFVPSILNGLLKLYEQRKPQTISHEIKLCFLGTAPVTQLEKQNFEKKFSLEVYENYGLSETTFISAEINAHDRQNRNDKCVGRKIPGIDIQIQPSIDLNIDGVHNIGEIYVKTPYLFEGYLTTDGLQKPALNDEGYFNTYDLGSLKENDQLYLYGRNRNVIKKGGQLIFLDEIESILMESGLADEYVAVNCSHEFYGESYNLFIKSDIPNQELKVNVHAWIQENLSKNKWPENIFTIDNVPKTSSGKVQKHLLNNDQ